MLLHPQVMNVPISAKGISQWRQRDMLFACVFVCTRAHTHGDCFSPQDHMCSDTMGSQAASLFSLHCLIMLQQLMVCQCFHYIAQSEEYHIIVVINHRQMKQGGVCQVSGKFICEKR